MKIIKGDCLEEMKKLEENSVDSIVTDPPAGISFMGKEWDKDKGGRDSWIKWMQEVATECKRVLKPGGHAFVWAIPRTSHWTATAWENAGFEIRDVVAHIFGSGFPKSLNIGKAVDKLQGNEREVVGKKEGTYADIRSGSLDAQISGQRERLEVMNTKGTSEYEGWGTALKPAREDWLLMRKPLDKGLTIAENCLKWRTGGINIDESRVGYEKNDLEERTKRSGINCLNKEYDSADGKEFSLGKATVASPNQMGRFPANLIHDNSEEVRECFPETKSTPSPGHFRKGNVVGDNRTSKGAGQFGDGNWIEGSSHNDSGNASRFFKSIAYVPKASKSERNKGCEGLEEKDKYKLDNSGNSHEIHSKKNKRVNPQTGELEERKETDGLSKNNHPTVKPIALMQYLIKMVTQKGGTVLDPFMGSGSTGVACVENGFDFIGIDMTPEYIEIAKARISHAEKEQKGKLFY